MQQETYALPGTLHLSDVARPNSVAEVAEMLRLASERDIPVIPIGGGTALSVGNRVDHEFLGIDIRQLSGVRSYEPADLTASFHAGTTLAEVSAVLAEHGQELPLDLPQMDQATIGGLVATGFSGPRRLGSGTLKDLLIGCAYVRGDGLIAKAGGMLVKNVSGFEISRLLHGSWGSLAILTSVNLKVVPKPKADFTFVRECESLDDAMTAQKLLLEHHPLIHASVIENREGRWSLHVRLLGRESALKAQVSSIEDDLGRGTELIEDDRFWRPYNERWAPIGDNIRLVLGARPHAVPELARVVAEHVSVRSMAVSISTGSVRVELDPATVTEGELAAWLSAVCPANANTWVLESAPVSWRRDMPAWSHPGESVSVMRSIKQQFDPAGILNRGRLVI